MEFSEGRICGKRLAPPILSAYRRTFLLHFDKLQAQCDKVAKQVPQINDSKKKPSFRAKPRIFEPKIHNSKIFPFRCATVEKTIVLGTFRQSQCDKVAKQIPQINDSKKPSFRAKPRNL